MRILTKNLFATIFFVLCYLPYALAEDSEYCQAALQFTFAWQLVDQCSMKPRGGSSRGIEVVLDKSTSPGWRSLQEKDIDKFERDRRAILAMTGPYRVSFDFLETVGYTADYRPDRPYQSWGTEYVYLVEDKKDFISLQHILVMFVKNNEGKIQEPIVTKHWRQDWQYEKRRTMVYAGHRRWQQKKYSRNETQGTWSQAVFQVDDSPRYEAIGAWQHHGNMSTWISDETWRPLPRREFSVRDDYQVLVGTNRHTITPTGWVQEEENYKTRLDHAGLPLTKNAYLAKELGVARYERIVDFDFSAGDSYWENTQHYWRDVRAQWVEIIDTNKSFSLKDQVDGQSMFRPFFQHADEINDSKLYNSEEGKQRIEETLDQYVVYE